MNRRSFFQSILSVGGVFAAGSILSQSAGAQERRRGGAAKTTGPVLADPKDPVLAAMLYVHKFSDLKDKSVVTEKQGVKPADQKCNACSFYVKLNKDNKVNGMNVGGCQMPQFTGKVISSEGYCSSWNKKA